MVKLLIGSLLALTVSNAVADNVFIYEDDNQQASTPSNNKVEDEDNIFIYENSNQSYKSTEKVVTFRDKNGSIATTTSTFADSPYAALR